MVALPGGWPSALEVHVVYGDKKDGSADGFWLATTWTGFGASRLAGDAGGFAA
jgi:hypothetical protein